MAGVGSEIKRVLQSFYINSHTGCGCEDLAREMDSVGSDRVEENLELYVAKMRESIKKWRAESNIPIPQPPDIVIEQLIHYGIKKSRSL